MAISVVLYLQLLGLPEPSGWEGDHHLLVIYLWSVATLRDWRNLTGQGTSGGCRRPAVPGRCAWHSASGAAVAMVAGRLAMERLTAQLRGVTALAARRLTTQDGNSGAGRLFAYMPHTMIDALIYNQRLLFFKAQHRRYIFPIQNKVE